MASVGTKFGAHESNSLSPPILDDDVLSAAWTGLRQGEILGLQWEDIDFTSRSWRFDGRSDTGISYPGVNRSAVDRLAEATGRNLTATDEEVRERGRDVIPEEDWSRRRDLNPRPADYESAALPLSYTGLSRTYDRFALRFYSMC